MQRAYDQYSAERDLPRFIYVILGGMGIVYASVPFPFLLLCLYLSNTYDLAL